MKMDEIKEKRNMKQVADGFMDAAHGLYGQDVFIEFSQWMSENMPHDKVKEFGNSVMGSVTGMVIGTWFDAGADDKLVKEYLSRFVDFCWAQYKGTIEYAEKYAERCTGGDEEK